MKYLENRVWIALMVRNQAGIKAGILRLHKG
jgi:hypothetical protein